MRSTNDAPGTSTLVYQSRRVHVGAGFDLDPRRDSRGHGRLRQAEHAGARVRGLADDAARRDEAHAEVGGARAAVGVDDPGEALGQQRAIAADAVHHADVGVADARGDAHVERVALGESDERRRFGSDVNFATASVSRGYGASASAAPQSTNAPGHPTRRAAR